VEQLPDVPVQREPVHERNHVSPVELQRIVITLPSRLASAPCGGATSAQPITAIEYATSRRAMLTF